jgi:hypothetical protein
MQVQKYYGRNDSICDVLSRNYVVHLIRKVAEIFCVSHSPKDERSDQCELLTQYDVWKKRLKELQERQMFWDVTACRLVPPPSGSCSAR